MPGKGVVIVDSKYHREQFDDWLSGGTVIYGGKTYYWNACDSGNGYGWEVEVIHGQDGENLDEDVFDQIVSLIEKALCKHETEYTFDL